MIITKDTKNKNNLEIIAEDPERIEDLETILNFIYEGSYILYEYEYRLFYGGLLERDIKGIEREIKRLSNIEYYIKQNIEEDISSRYTSFNNYEKWNNLIEYEKYLLKEVGNVGIRLQKILDSLEKTCGCVTDEQFIINNSSLLHIVSTNNHSKCNIPIRSDDAYFYICHFHIERRPSMRVNNHTNKLFCYGCGYSENLVSYIMKIENISKKNAIFLLARINRIELANNPYQEDDEIVKKYTNSRALNRYETRVDSGLKRATHKKKTLNNYLTIKKYEQEKSTINRIRNNEYIANDKNNKGKVLSIEMPKF